MKCKTIKESFILKRKEFLTPNLIRVYLKNDNSSLLRNFSSGDSCKLLFPPLEIKNINNAEFCTISKKWICSCQEFKPVARTYTLRKIDRVNNQIIIDFVNHGLNGPGSRWANETIVGNSINISIKSKKKDFISKKDFVFLATDLTGLPVVSTIIETLSQNVKGIVCIEVPTKNDIYLIESKANLEFKWIINPDIGNSSALFDLIRNQNFPKRKEGERFAYIVGESKLIKESKLFFRDFLEWKKDEFCCICHWKKEKLKKKSLEKVLQL